MPKKPVKKKVVRKKRQILPNVFTRFAALSVGVVLLIFVYALFTKTDRVRVLGVTTDSTNNTYSKEQLAEKETSSYVDSTEVDCIGPDGGHFVTTYTECKNFNKSWGNKDFKFTKLKSDEEVKKEQVLKEEKLKKIESEKEALKQKELSKKQIKEVEVKKIDEKTVVVKERVEKIEPVIKQEQKQPQKDIAKEEIKEVKTLKTKIKSGNIEAETELTVKVDEKTNKISVETETGSHDVNILPAHAVQNLIQLDVLTSVESTGDQETATAEATSNTIQLTEIDGKPAFEVQGLNQKKLLGLFPVAYTKKVYVSIDDGKIIKTEEDLTNKLLQLLSF